MFGGWKEAGLDILRFMVVIWSVPIMLAIVKIGMALGAIPGKAAKAAVAAEAELSKVGKGGLAGKAIGALGAASIADEALSAADPEDKIGSWVDRNVPGAAAVDNLASKFGLGRSYEQQKQAEDKLRPPAEPPPPPPANQAAAGKASFDQLTKLGWSPAQAAGLVANFGKESSFNPAAVGDGGHAYGIGQWHEDRQANFAKWTGHDIRGSSLQEQLGFADYELRQGTEQGAGKALAAANDPRTAGSIVSSRYERPADRSGEMIARGASAQGYFNQFAGAAPPASLSSTAIASSAAGSPGPSGKIDVGIRMSGEPAGTQVTTRQQGDAFGGPPAVQRSSFAAGNGFS